jgi:hypothetical protein
MLALGAIQFLGSPTSLPWLRLTLGTVTAVQTVRTAVLTAKPRLTTAKKEFTNKYKRKSLIIPTLMRKSNLNV